MIVIEDFKMPENCLKCPMQFGGWCYVSPPEVDERVAPTVDEAWVQGKPDWCPLIDVPEMNVGNSSEIPNRSTECISRQAAIDALCSVCGVDCDKSKFVYGGKQEDQVIFCPEHYALTQLPSEQPEVIRCKDCVWSMTGDFSKKFFCSLTGALAWAEPDSFCSYAVRKINGPD